MRSQTTIPLTIIMTWFTSIVCGQPLPSQDHEKWVWEPTQYSVPLLYRQELEMNLLWMIDRETARIESSREDSLVVGVYADAGAWHLGARSIVFALEHAGIRCHVLDHAAMGYEDLAKLEAIIIPGGYASYMRMGIGSRGIEALRRRVDDGGVYLGVCAGAYFASKTVLWENQLSSYSLRLFDGIAEGPISELATWPGTAGVTMDVVDRRDVYRELGAYKIYYQGGCRFLRGTNVQIIARYPDRTNAIIERPYGSGRVVLSGGHFERWAPEMDPTATLPPPESAGRIYATLLGLTPDFSRPASAVVPWHTDRYRSTFSAMSKPSQMLERERSLRLQLNQSKNQGERRP